LNLFIRALKVCLRRIKSLKKVLTKRKNLKTEKREKRKKSGKNPKINWGRQALHMNGTPNKTQFKEGTNAAQVSKLVKDAWRNGVPYYGKGKGIIGKVKVYRDVVGPDGQKAIDVRFSRKNGIHSWPSWKRN